MTTDYIFHISDLHIGSHGKAASRFNEYMIIFNKFKEIISKYNKAIVVITGDIFHFAEKYNGADVQLFKNLLNLIKQYEVVIIPGNHDISRIAIDDIDLISPLLDSYTNITYIKNTQIFKVSGIQFHHIFFNDTTISACDDSMNTILLWHGFVNGARFGKHVVNESKISREMLLKYKIVLLGDIHETQAVLDHAAYAGSLIQQNLSESREKGFLIWDINKRKSSFIKIDNDTGLIKLDLRGKTAKECAVIVANTEMPRNLLKLSIVSDSDELKEQINIVENKFGKINTINHVMTSTLNPNKDIFDTLKSMLCEKLSSDIVDQLLIADEHIFMIQERKRWTILNMEWSNIMKYGENNYIDFTTLEGGISGVIGNNCIGKSTIIDIIVYALFGELIRNTKETFIRYGTNKSYVKIELMVNKQKYCIIRYDNRSTRKNNIVKFIQYSSGATEKDPLKDISANCIIDTNNKIKALIGTREQFFATSLFYYSYDDVFRADSVRRLSLLSSLFGMIDATPLIKEVSKKKKDAALKIQNLVKPHEFDAAAKLVAEQEKLDKMSKQYNILNIKRKSITNRSSHIILKDVNEYKSKLQKINNQINILQDKIEIDVEFAQEVVVTKVELLLAESIEPNIEEINGILNKLNIKKENLISIKPIC